MNLVTYNGQLVTSNGNAITADLSSMLPSGIGCGKLIDQKTASIDWRKITMPGGYNIFATAVPYGMHVRDTYGHGNGILTDYVFCKDANENLRDRYAKIGSWLVGSGYCGLGIRDDRYSTLADFLSAHGDDILFYKKATS